MLSFKGIYVHPVNENLIAHVAIESSFGERSVISVQSYVDEKIQPPYTELPTTEEFLAAEQAPAGIVQLLHRSLSEPVSHEEAQRLSNVGFIVFDEQGEMRITPAGRETLALHGLLR